MRVLQTARFKKQTKKLHSNQTRDLNTAIRSIITNPSIGEMKKGTLSGVRVHKFRMSNQLTLLAYEIDGTTIILLALGSHENFYRDMT